MWVFVRAVSGGTGTSWRRTGDPCHYSRPPLGDGKANTPPSPRAAQTRVRSEEDIGTSGTMWTAGGRGLSMAEEDVSLGILRYRAYMPVNGLSAHPSGLSVSPSHHQGRKAAEVLPAPTTEATGKQELLKTSWDCSCIMHQCGTGGAISEESGDIRVSLHPCAPGRGKCSEWANTQTRDTTQGTQGNVLFALWWMTTSV